MIAALKEHWPEYLMEAAGLGLFMISAGLFGTLLEAPSSPVPALLPDPLVRRVLMGLAMGATAVGFIYSPWGQRSGAHINPAVTLTFLRLGKVRPWDALFYVLAQFAGGTLGVVAVAVALGAAFATAPVRFVVTLPGLAGAGTAFAAEAAISFGLMLAVLVTSNRDRWSRYTGWIAGLLVALYISVEAPLSGMSMNPARSFASALPAGLLESLWIYMTAPVLGMLAAAELYRRGGLPRIRCAKLNHHGPGRCIFRCGWAAARAPQEA